MSDTVRIKSAIRSFFSGAVVLAWAITGCTEAQQAAAPAQSGDDPNRVLAVVNGVELTEARIIEEAGDDLSALDRQRLEFEAKQRESRYDVLRRNLDQVIADELIKAEAASQNLSTEELLKAEVDDKVMEPSEEEIDRIYEINKSRLNKPKEEVRDQIVDFLQGRARQARHDEFVDSLKAKYEVIDRMEPMRYEIAHQGRPVKGASDPLVTLVEFSDFQCPYCTRLTAEMYKVMDQYGDRVQRVFMQFPLNSIHPQAQEAAEASLCANDQDHFWDLHRRLFESPSRLGEEAIITKASEIGLDMDTFKECLSSGRHAKNVTEDQQLGIGLGVSGTPALFVNGRPLRGAATAAQISAMIEEELKSKGAQ